MKNLLLLLSAVLLLTSCNQSELDYINSEIRKEIKKESLTGWEFEVISYTTKKVNNLDANEIMIEFYKNNIKDYRAKGMKALSLGIGWEYDTYIKYVKEYEEELKSIYESIERSPMVLQYKVDVHLTVDGKLIEGKHAFYVTKEL